MQQECPHKSAKNIPINAAIGSDKYAKNILINMAKMS
jgi:hypothetical protein